MRCVNIAIHCNGISETKRVAHWDSMYFPALSISYIFDAHFFSTAHKNQETLFCRQNMALLYSNKARLMRLCSQAYGNSTRPTEEVNRGEFTQQERLYFNKVRTATFLYCNLEEDRDFRTEMPTLLHAKRRNQKR